MMKLTKTYMETCLWLFVFPTHSGKGILLKHLLLISSEWNVLKIEATTVLSILKFYWRLSSTELTDFLFMIEYWLENEVIPFLQFVRKKMLWKQLNYENVEVFIQFTVTIQHNVIFVDLGRLPILIFEY